jgi:hypothetical protein
MRHPHGQTPTFHEPHRVILNPAVFSYFEDGYDVLVVEGRGGFRLGLKPTNLVAVGKFSGPDNFQRHNPVETDLSGFVDDPHATAGYLGQQLVIPEPLSHHGRRQHCREHPGSTGS